MTNDDDMMIREMAREICAKRYEEDGALDDAKAICAGDAWYGPILAIAEAGIRAGIKLGRSL